jgi:hypothetical protein
MCSPTSPASGRRYDALLGMLRQIATRETVPQHGDRAEVVVSQDQHRCGPRQLSSRRVAECARGGAYRGAMPSPQWRVVQARASYFASNVSYPLTMSTPGEPSNMSGADDYRLRRIESVTDAALAHLDVEDLLLDECESCSRSTQRPCSCQTLPFSSLLLPLPGDRSVGPSGDSRPDREGLRRPRRGRDAAGDH